MMASLPPRSRRSGTFRSKLITLAAVVVSVTGALFAASVVDMDHLHESPLSAAYTTTGPWNSMVYLAATDSGVVAIDLGWSGSRGRFVDALASLGKAPEDVEHVFVTHGHRDHIAGWPWVPDATFHMQRDEVRLFLGQELPSDWPSRIVERMKGTPRPAAGSVALAPFGRDTVFDLGEPLHAFAMPGHTPGSAAYLFRGVLFMGDAVSHMPIRSFHGAATIYSYDMEQARESLVTLFRDRVRLDEVEWVCTAHGKCSRPTEAFIEKVTR